MVGIKKTSLSKMRNHFQLIIKHIYKRLDSSDKKFKDFRLIYRKNLYEMRSSSGELSGVVDNKKQVLLDEVRDCVQQELLKGKQTRSDEDNAFWVAFANIETRLQRLENVRPNP